MRECVLFNTDIPQTETGTRTAPHTSFAPLAPYTYLYALRTLHTTMRTTYIAVLLTIFLVGCKTPQPTVGTTDTPDTNNGGTTVVLQERPRYQASKTHTTDLLHTKLEVDFDWKYSKLNGKAWLDFKPWFYPTDILVLDAKRL